jgi:hypothetical protein
MWFPTPDQVAFAVKEAGDAYKAYTKHKALILDLFDFAWHRGQMPTFIVFGPGGDGKSTLKKFLETLDQGSIQTQYGMSLTRETGQIKGRRFSNVAVFPGQPEYRDPQMLRYREWLQKLRKNPRLFIALCFSYGYRAIDVNQPLSREAFQANPEARKEELEYAKEILGKIHSMCQFPRYTIFSMILKQDLWWDQKDEVQEFYETQYKPIIIAFSNQAVGKDNLQHYVFPMCLIRSNLKDRNGIIVQKGSGSYDDDSRRNYTMYFLNNLQSILRES